jgi:aquaporin Z
MPNINLKNPVIFGIEVMASAFLMSIIWIVVYTKGLKGFSETAIGGHCQFRHILLVIYLWCFNDPARSLAVEFTDKGNGTLLVMY